MRFAGPAIAGFPTRDGGLFAVMATDLQQSGFVLPSFTTYNDGTLPFVYPPAGFYVLGALDSVLPATVVELLQWLPPLIASVLVPAVFLLARELLGSDRAGLAAAFVYAVSPRAFEWTVAGGGLTRSLGLLCAVITLWCALVAVRHPAARYAIAAGLLGGLTVLSHPQAAVFVVLSVLLLGSWDPKGLARLSLHAVPLALLVVAPWIATLAARGHLPLLLSLGGRWNPAEDAGLLIGSQFSGAHSFDVISVAVWLGAAVAVYRGLGRLLAWPLLVVIFGAGGGGFMFAVPVAVLSAVAIEAAYDTALSRVSHLRRRAVFVGLIGVELAVVAGTSALVGPTASLSHLTTEDRAAMAWAGALPDDGSFAVVTGAFWGADPISEWFPALTGKVNIGTVQGSEWLGKPEFTRRMRIANRLQECMSPDCIARVMNEQSPPARWAYFVVDGPSNCCSAMAEAAVDDPRFKLVRRLDAAAIYELVNARGSKDTVAVGAP